MRWLAALFLLPTFPVVPTAPPLVIKNATVVVAPGRSLEKASVVLRDGLIQDVGVTSTFLAMRK